MAGHLVTEAPGRGPRSRRRRRAGDRPSRHFVVELLGPSESDRPTGHDHNRRVRTEPLPG
jgi:hypothetical protein